MGKKTRARRQPKKRVVIPLSTTFTCPFCNHEKAIEVTINRKERVAMLACVICKLEPKGPFTMQIRALDQPIDIYANFIQECERINQPPEVEDDQDPAGHSEGDDYEPPGHRDGAPKPTRARGYDDYEDDLDDEDDDYQPDRRRKESSKRSSRDYDDDDDDDGEDDDDDLDYRASSSRHSRKRQHVADDEDDDFENF
ncbi:hypothetical protein H696_04334 [Fonticula alba]|uniref:Transcription elongation factor 1 homolog n=1 Tax=Fonticula alba TaxID=691883 RepID=A0A058Z4R2_FONAL|nr:hypothetical protein H696_04334 [Fonticula alba]KCV68913.1 hypothetical protein H696_04334 [Fonticula alba]|eukprot:XP_009496484.1 hypothetical protein H696_04334 [Fonticula alba]